MMRNATVIFVRMLGIIPFFFTATCLRGQDNVPTGLTNQFHQYQANHFQEKLFVHADKSFYLAGELIWFKVYAVDAMTNRPSAMSKVAYVEIISKENKPLLQAKIGLVDASGNGSFLIPYSLASGNYILRAYTKWMKNFSPEGYFQEPLTIVNSLKELSPAAIQSQTGYRLRLFPEGGNLVAGLASRLAFKLDQSAGEPINFSGCIVSADGDTVQRFTSFRYGMGSFPFTPATNQHYTAIAFLPDTVIRQDLPLIHPEGWVMNLEDPESEQLKLWVRTNAALSNSPVFLLVYSGNSVKKVQSATIKDGVADFTIDRKQLDEGISHFAVFNQGMQPLCERLYFLRPAHPLAIALSTDKPAYTTREKVNLVVTPPTGSQADMSLSVYRVDSFQTAAYDHIDHYFLLTSELGGRVVHPEYYFEDPASARAADNLMLTQGWRRFTWEDVRANNKQPAKYVPELEGHVLDGTVSGKFDHVPAKNIETFFSIPDSAYNFGATLSKADGRFSVNAKNVFGIHDVVFRTLPRDSIYKIEISNPYSDSFSTVQPPAFSLADKTETSLLTRSINSQAQNAYQSDLKLHTFFPIQRDTTPFFGRANKRYNLDDYTRFVTMEEVLREYVLPIHVRKRGNNYEFRVSNNPQRTYFDDDPLTLVDGVPVFNIDKVMALDPLKLKRIDVIDRRYFLGDNIYNGVVSIKSYQGDLGGYQLETDALILEYEFLQYEREFYAPAYDDKSKGATIPDYRNQLFWSPAVKVSSASNNVLSFCTPDIPGTYQIVVQGITKEGLSGSKALSFDVK